MTAPSGTGRLDLQGTLAQDAECAVTYGWASASTPMGVRVTLTGADTADLASVPPPGRLFSPVTLTVTDEYGQSGH